MTFQTFNELGYLEQPYLEEAYMVSTAWAVGGMQVEFQIEDTEDTHGMQFEGQIVDSLDVSGFQFEGQIVDSLDVSGFQFEGNIVDFQTPLGMQFEGFINEFQNTSGFQFEGFINEFQNTSGVQSEGTIDSETPLGMQFEGNILDFENTTGFQVQMDVADTPNVYGAEWQLNYFKHVRKLDGYLEGAYLEGPYLKENMCAIGGFQFAADVNDFQNQTGMQFEGNILDTEDTHGFQFEGNIEDAENTTGMQWEGFINDFQNAIGMQFIGQIVDYIDVEVYGGFQFENNIVDTEVPVGFQFTAQQLSTTGFQFLVGLYNITNLRLMCAFPSRGTNTTATDYASKVYTNPSGNVVSVGTIDHGLTIGDTVLITEVGGGDLNPGYYVITGGDSNNFEFTGTFSGGTKTGTLDWTEANSWGTQLGSGQNWTSNSTMTGDFEENNLNTDFTEEVWRSNNTVTNVRVDCDTEITQGVAIDTLAILNHNFTQGATVTLIGSNSNTFATIDIQIDLEVTPRNIYYIAPELPLTGYRFWRIEINDASNGDGYLEMGTVVFGSSRVFQGECFVDEVEFQEVDFADTVKTAGFTNVSNSRSQQRRLSLEFRFLDFLKGNFGILKDVFRDQRTVQKCLWIPTPSANDQTVTDRFAVFAKLTTIPTERHNNKGPDADYVSFSIDLDESN